MEPSQAAARALLNESYAAPPRISELFSTASFIACCDNAEPAGKDWRGLVFTEYSATSFLFILDIAEDDETSSIDDHFHSSANFWLGGERVADFFRAVTELAPDLDIQPLDEAARTRAPEGMFFMHTLASIEEIVGRDFLSLQDVSERLSVSVDTVRRLVDSGELPRVKVRGTVRVPVDGYRNYVDGIMPNEVDVNDPLG